MELMTWTDERLAERFERVDERFDHVDRRMDERFDAVDQRFDAVDRRMDEADRRTNERFDAVDQRFDDLSGTFRELKAEMVGARDAIWALHRTALLGGFGALASLIGVIAAILVAG